MPFFRHLSIYCACIACGTDPFQEHSGSRCAGGVRDPMGPRPHAVRDAMGSEAQWGPRSHGVRDPMGSATPWGPRPHGFATRGCHLGIISPGLINSMKIFKGNFQGQSLSPRREVGCSLLQRRPTHRYRKPLRKAQQVREQWPSCAETRRPGCV